MATLRDNVLPVVNTGREIVDNLGFRQFTTALVSRTWDSGSPRVGDPTDVTTTLSPSPKVKENDDGITLLIGPITPLHSTGGYAPPTLRPADVDGVEFFWTVTGPFASGFATLKCKPTHIDTSKPLRYMVTVKILERKVPH